MDVFMGCILTNSISIISGNVFQKSFNIIMQIIFHYECCGILNKFIFI